MLNLKKKYTKSQRRINKRRESEKQKRNLIKTQKRRNRKFRQKSKKNQFDLELKKSRKLRDITRIYDHR